MMYFFRIVGENDVFFRIIGENDVFC